MNIDGLYKTNDCVDVSAFLNESFDIDKVLSEIESNTNTKHKYSRQSCVGWYGLPLRSAGGKIGRQATLARGENNSPDPNVYKDTILMTDSISRMIKELNSPTLKVRVLKLKPLEEISPHVDNFQGGDKILRLHFPLITDPKVLFYIDGTPYFISPGKLWYVNVRKRHWVVNKSMKERIHIVIDIERTDEIDEKFKKVFKK